jgi:hypothetical protein
VRERLGYSTFEKAMKVSIVRNPYDVLTSLYFWIRKLEKNDNNTINFRQWLMRNPSYINKNFDQYFIDGDNVIDFYIRFENISDDIRRLEKKKPALFGLSELFSNIKSKTNIRPSSTKPFDLFKDDETLIEAVRFFNEPVIKKFRYQIA